MPILLSLIRKEALHIVRDKRTMLVTVIMPVVLLLLFGFAISTEVNDVRLVAVVDSHTPLTRSLLEKFRSNDYFTFLGTAAPADIEPMLRRGEIDATLMLRTAQDGSMATRIIVDASNPTLGQAAASYIQGVLADSGAPEPIITRTLYNPQMKSAYNFVPGIMGMIFILICAIMTSVSIVSEKETGTMNLLLVSPVHPRTIIFGKLIPYFLLSCLILAVMLILSYTVLGLPLSSTVFVVIAITLLYIVLSLSLGLLVSTLVDNQISALVVSAVLFMLPVIMLSGMIFPIDNMPQILQWLSCIIPARWYIEAMRKLMIQQLPFSYIASEAAILLSITALLLTLAIKNFNNKK